MASLDLSYLRKESQPTDLVGIAEQAGIKPPEPGKPLFSRVTDILNAPSRFVEKGITGGQTYEQLGLPGPAAFTARLLLDPLNLVGMLGLGSKVLKGAGVAAKLAGKIKPIGTTGRALEELFVPFAKLAKVSPQLAKELPALETVTRARQARAVTAVGELFKGFSPEIRQNIGKLVEKAGAGGKLADNELQAVQRVTKFIEEGITQPEIQAGVSPKLLINYFPHKVERDAVENLLKFGGKRLSLGLGGAEKKRKFLTFEAGEVANVVYKEPAEALAMRASVSEAARANAGFLKRLIGGEVKDIEGNPLIMSAKEGIGQGYSEFSIKELRGLQAPAEAVNEIEKYYKTFISDDATNKLLGFYDSALGIWKGSVTSIFPAFHIRNIIGNLSNMWIGGFTDISKIGQAGLIQKGGEITIKGTKVTKELLEDLGIMGRGQFGADIPQVLSDVLGKKSLVSRLNPLRALDIGRKAGTVVEDNSRIAMFLDRLNKGDSIQQAVAQVHKYLFDYTALTPFEKNAMRRIVPFYTWIRNNLPLQIENLIKQPGKYAAITKTFTNLTPLTEEERATLPQYLKEGLVAGLGKNVGEQPKEPSLVGKLLGFETLKPGELRTLTSLGMPFEDIGRLYRGGIGRTVEREVIGATGPLGNLLGLVINRDFFRGKNTNELDYTYGKAAEKYPEPIKKFLGFRKEEVTTKAGETYDEYYVDKKKFQLLQLAVPRILRTLSDPEAGLQFYRTQNIDLPKQKISNENQLNKELERILIEKGFLKEFTKTFVPKNISPLGNLASFQ